MQLPPVSVHLLSSGLNLPVTCAFRCRSDCPLATLTSRPTLNHQIVPLDRNYQSDLSASQEVNQRPADGCQQSRSRWLIFFRVNWSCVNVSWVICVRNNEDNGACTVKHNEHRCMCLSSRLLNEGRVFFLCLWSPSGGCRSVCVDCSMFFCVWLVRFL